MMGGEVRDGALFGLFSAFFYSFSFVVDINPVNKGITLIDL